MLDVPLRALYYVVEMFRWPCHCLLSPRRAVNLHSIDEHMWGSSIIYSRCEYLNRTTRYDLWFEGAPLTCCLWVVRSIDLAWSLLYVSSSIAEKRSV